MISVKTDKNYRTEVHLSGSNLMLFGELIAVCEAVSKTIFNDNEKDRIAMLADLPRMVLKSSSTETSRIELPCPLEDLKKFGGDQGGVR